MAGPSVSQIDSVVNVILLIQFEPEPHSSRRQEFIETKIAPRSRDSAEAGKCYEPKAIRQFASVLSLSGKHPSVLVLAGGISAQVTARSIEAKIIKRGVGAHGACGAAIREHLPFSERVKSVIRGLIRLIGTIAPQGLSKKISSKIP